MLTLSIKKKWFDMILSGEKKEEYREIKPYYDSRFIKKDIDYDPELNMMVEQEKIRQHRLIWLKNGYRKDSPKILCQCYVFVGYGKKEWGATPGKLYYVLRIDRILEVKKCIEKYYLEENKKIMMNG